MSRKTEPYSTTKHIRGCRINGGPVDNRHCPKCNQADPPSVQKFYAALMRVDKGSRR